MAELGNSFADTHKDLLSGQTDSSSCCSELKHKFWLSLSLTLRLMEGY